jgi:O-succinylbenzoate synthase
VTAADRLQLSWRPFAFALPRALVTAQGVLRERRGWLLRLQDAGGQLGWGEASPLESDHARCAAVLVELQGPVSQRQLEQQLPSLPDPLACALGMALAEWDGLGRAGLEPWRCAPASAHLLPAGQASLPALDQALEQNSASGQPLTVKWKVAAQDPDQEWQLLEPLLARLPAEGRLRLDANGGWDRAMAQRWADRLRGEPRLEWLEQPLAAADHQGLEALALQLPVALDESLRVNPALALRWPSWQVRRPLLEGDPRPLLQLLRAGRPRLMLSTAFETGIGRRLLSHLAALQWLGPTPTAPGLAPGWRPQGELFSNDPQRVWAAAA